VKGRRPLITRPLAVVADSGISAIREGRIAPLKKSIETSLEKATTAHTEVSERLGRLPRAELGREVAVRD